MLATYCHSPHIHLRVRHYLQQSLHIASRFVMPREVGSQGAVRGLLISSEAPVVVPIDAVIDKVLCVCLQVLPVAGPMHLAAPTFPWH